MFSQKGYCAVSIRDICKQVKIKENSIYYHFKNKQAIFDEILERFQNKADGMMAHLTSILPTQGQALGGNSFFEVCNHFFDSYHINSKRFIICHSLGQKIQTMGCYLLPIKMGNLLSKMTENYDNARVEN